MSNPNLSGAAKWSSVLKIIPLDTNKKQLVTAGKGLQIHAGNEALALVDGVETYRAMYEAIQTTLAATDGSRYYVYLLGWWLDDSFPLVSRVSTSTLQKLFEQASAKKVPVQLRVMVWYNPFRLLSHALIIRRINNLKNGGAIHDLVKPLFKRSHHQKILIVKGNEGLIGFCGGLDLSTDRIEAVEHHPGSPYHDVHCRLKGDAVRDLVDIFEQRWVGSPESKKIDDKKGRLRSQEDHDSQPPKTDQKAAGKQYVGIARTFNIIAPNIECAKEYSVQAMFINAIRAAQRFIYIEEQYLIHLQAAEELRNALAKIQHLTILIPHGTISDLPSVWERRRQFLSVLNDAPPKLQSKVGIYYRISSPPKREAGHPFSGFDDPGAQTFSLSDDPIPRSASGDYLGKHAYIHAKCWIFDDELAVIGSANCNRRGWSYDSEVDAAIFDVTPTPSTPSFARRLRKRLWCEHLGIKESFLEDGIGSAKYWRQLRPESRVRLYDPNEDLHQQVWVEEIDPFTGPRMVRKERGSPPSPRRLSAESPVNITELLDSIADPTIESLKACPPTK